jgi:predicted cupin superfamily sugar epimerase
MYLTIDPKHLSHLHMVQHGQSWMYSLGDATIAHCFTQDGQYHKVTLGLDKSKGQVHGFYVDAGTFVAFEDAGDSGAGFSQISGSIPSNSDGRIMIPRKSELLKIFPQQANLINRLSAKEE